MGPREFGPSLDDLRPSTEPLDVTETTYILQNTHFHQSEVSYLFLLSFLTGKVDHLSLGGTRVHMVLLSWESETGE